MLNALLTSATENLSVLVVLLVWFIWQQSTRHKDLTSLRKEITDGNAALRKEIANVETTLRKEITDSNATLRKEIVGGDTALRKETTEGIAALRQETTEGFAAVRKDIAKQGERIAKIEGLLMGLAPYDTVAEPPPVDYEIEDKDGDGNPNK